MTLPQLLLLASLSACAPYEQAPEPKDAKDVQLVKTEPPSTCKEVGDLVGEAPNGPGAEGKAKTRLREKAAKVGANYAGWETLQISEDPTPNATTNAASPPPSLPSRAYALAPFLLGAPVPSAASRSTVRSASR